MLPDDRRVRAPGLTQHIEGGPDLHGAFSGCITVGTIRRSRRQVNRAGMPPPFVPAPCLDGTEHAHSGRVRVWRNGRRGRLKILLLPREVIFSSGLFTRPPPLLVTLWGWSRGGCSRAV